MKNFGFILTAFFGLLFFNLTAPAQTVVISQTYGGSGSATGSYTRDYVELFNASAIPQSLNGLAIQYGGATGQFGSTTALIYPLQNVTLQPGQYYLVGLASSTGLNPLPTAVDNTTTNTINMSGTQGKVALTNTTVALGCGATATPCTLPDVRILDSVAWGGSNNAEGSATVNNGVNITATQGGVRKLNGCQDTNNNNADFDVITNPVPRNTASAANSCGASDIDLTIARTVNQTTVALNATVIYTITVSNSGTTTANNVRATFVVPSGLTYASSTVNGGFTASETGGTVTFNGGTVPNGGSVVLTVSTTATTQGTTATSATSGVTVDPANTITETNETNNNATNATATNILFPATISGLFGRPTLAQLMTDISNIGGAQTVFLNSNLTENTTITVPNGLIIDFGSFVVNGAGNFFFNDGGGIQTSHPNGIGDATHPGNIQTAGATVIGTTTDFTYYLIPLLSEFGSIGQTAYGMPSQIDSFTINNFSGLTIVAPFTATGDFFLTNGIVNNSANTITLSAFSRINGSNFGEGSENSFVAGKMKKIVPGGGDLANGLPTGFVFPVGTIGGAQNGYSPLKAQNYSTVQFGSSLTVQAFDIALPGVATPRISRYWQIDESGNVMTDLNFNWRTGDDSAIVTPADVRIFRGTSNACAMNLANCTINTVTRTATITAVTDFSPWGLAQFVPNAAGVNIGGRVRTADGTGLANATVTLTDQLGNSRTVRTSSFGYFFFEDLEAGDTYILSVTMKQRQFTPQAVTASEEATNIEFIPQD